MTPPRAQMQQLITSGLYATNLAQLLSLTEQLFQESPALYGSLTYVFKSLESAWDESSGQVIPGSRYNHITQHLTQPLLDALDAESAGPAKLLDKLNILHAALDSM